jgi:hypothetical protein
MPVLYISRRLNRLNIYQIRSLNYVLLGKRVNILNKYMDYKKCNIPFLDM